MPPSIVPSPSGKPARTWPKGDLHLWYLPPYSPKLNDIEPTFSQAQHEAVPQRLQPHARALTTAVHAYARDLWDVLTSKFPSLTTWRADGVVGCGRRGSVLQVKVSRRRSPDAMPPLSPASKYALLRARRGIGGVVSCVAGSACACPSLTTRHLGPAQVQSTNENRRWLPHRRKGCAHRSHAGVDRDRAQAAVRPPGGAGACSDVTGAGALGAPHVLTCRPEPH
ncbi:MAG: hypothetical protein F4Z18_11645 [Caldilineaceae bacterium SB0666_bin_21]|nr:hypothetical protein [Caldilineaceae bacterium SB0666_bin_21]